MIALSSRGGGTAPLPPPCIRPWLICHLLFVSMFVCIQLFKSLQEIKIESRLHCFDINEDDCTILFYPRSEDFPDIVPGKSKF